MRHQVLVAVAARSGGPKDYDLPAGGIVDDVVEVDAVLDYLDVLRPDHDERRRRSSIRQSKSDKVRTVTLFRADAGDTPVGDERSVFKRCFDEPLSCDDACRYRAFAFASLDEADSVGGPVDVHSVVVGDLAQPGTNPCRGGLLGGGWGAVVPDSSGVRLRTVRVPFGSGGIRVSGVEYHADDASGACGALRAFDSNEIGIVPADRGEVSDDVGATVNVVREVFDAEVGSPLRGRQSAWVNGGAAQRLIRCVSGTSEFSWPIILIESAVVESCDHLVGVRVDCSVHLPCSFQVRGKACGGVSAHAGAAGGSVASMDTGGVVSGRGGRPFCPHDHRRCGRVWRLGVGCSRADFETPEVVLVRLPNGRVYFRRSDIEALLTPVAAAPASHDAPAPSSVAEVSDLVTAV